MSTVPKLLLFGPLGPMEMGVVFVVILLLFGAKRLPQLARSMGKSLGEFRRAKDDFESELHNAGRDLEETASLDTNPHRRKTEDRQA